ncbi:thioredoxin family protein [Humisphaera borealis]|uniref:Thioredoxin family protein n=1 Tax=Humisphaera borealis TaxID=2807512 RepID=A0A7M2X106_9BACT|nr:thioredoxin family protein [Humisphaera borealis]QOV91344.1 thioredoxin family protein [Humisphaera borealis]
MAFTLAINDAAPDFDLPGTDGRHYTLASFADATALVVVFSCNHCPYVIGSEDRMIAFARRYASQGVRMIAINSNETDDHPTDSFEHMVERAREKQFPFAYARDDTQAVALAYGALRTPHYYVFTKDSPGPGVASDSPPDGGSKPPVWRLRYTGRMDDNPRNPGTEKTHELADAVDALLAGKQPAVAVTNPIGCNVKWKGKPHKWMPPEACDLV